MSYSKSLIEEFRLFEKDFATKKDLPFGFTLKKNLMKNVGNPQGVISSIQAVSNVPPGSTSQPSISNTPVPEVPQVGSNSTDTKPVTFMGQDVGPVLGAAENVGTNIIGAGEAALGRVVTGAGNVGRETIDYASSKFKGAGSDAMSGALSSLGTTLSKPKNLAALGAGALATGALVGTGATIANRVFGRRKKDKRKR